MTIYDLGIDNKQHNEVTVEYICSKLENMDDSKDGIYMSFIQKHQDEAVELNKSLSALGYVTNLKEENSCVNLRAWKYKKTDVV